MPDLARAIDEVKRLQAQWKTTGPVPHAQSQAMWEEFRALCNAVYERRQQEFAQQSCDAGAGEVRRRRAVQADRTGGPGRPGGSPQRRSPPARVAGGVPCAGRTAAQRRAQPARALPACDVRYDAQIAGLAQRAAEAAEANVLAAARHVRAYQRAVIQGDAARDELKTAAEAFITGVPRWPSKTILQALRQSLARADSAEFTQPDDAAREQALRKLCIHAEILSGTATPPEDASLRREQEMQLLRQGLGPGAAGR